MKKAISVLLLILSVLSVFALSGCGTDKALVESVMEIDSEYSGHRRITIKYPLSVHIDEFADALVSNHPFVDDSKSTFEYLGVDQDGYIFVMDLVFSSHDDYLSQVQALVGREVSSYMTQSSSVITTGTRMKEDFDTADLIAWMQSYAQSDDSLKSIGYDYDVNTVSINSQVFNTGSTIDICEREGMPINSITIETTNLKDGTYDRTITFSVPNKTYIDLSGSLEQYFTTNTSPAAQYCDWTSQGKSWEYTVIYKGIDIDELAQYTSMLLDTDAQMTYADKNNSGTPLSEGLIFEEEFDTFSFIGADGKEAQLVYKYALPTKTTHGDGSVFADGKWNVVGAWQEGVYSVDVDSDTMKIRIPDGIQYAINGIRMDLDVVGKNEFVRSTELLYSKTQGIDGMLYARDFFADKGMTVETDEDSDNLICRVICQGDASQITDQLVECFGSGNFMTYDIKESALSLSAKTKLTDYVDFSYMLNSTNANRPITYTVHSSGGENIIDLECDDADSAKVSDNSDALMVNVAGGRGTVVYHGNIPDIFNIVVYCVIGVVMLLATIAIIIYMLRKQHMKVVSKTDTAPSVSQQTTTFSIAELKSKQAEVDSKYLDEINKDIEEKIEADRIGNLSRQLKAKELEKLARMVNGEPIEDDDDQVEDDKSSKKEESVDDTPPIDEASQGNFSDKEDDNV